MEDPSRKQSREKRGEESQKFHGEKGASQGRKPGQAHEVPLTATVWTEPTCFVKGESTHPLGTPHHLQR